MLVDWASGINGCVGDVSQQRVKHTAALNLKANWKLNGRGVRMWCTKGGTRWSNKLEMLLWSSFLSMVVMGVQLSVSFSLWDIDTQRHACAVRAAPATIPQGGMVKATNTSFTSICPWMKDIHDQVWTSACPLIGIRCNRERERELRREGGKSLLAYVKGGGPYLS